MKWISVFDVVPCGDVLIYNKKDGMTVGSFDFNNYPYDWSTFLSEIPDNDPRKNFFKEVTHWMPLPQPPKDS